MIIGKKMKPYNLWSILPYYKQGVAMVTPCYKEEIPLPISSVLEAGKDLGQSTQC